MLCTGRFSTVPVMAEDQADKQHSGYGSELEALDFDLAEQVAETQNNKEQQGLVVAQQSGQIIEEHKEVSQNAKFARV